MPNFILRQSRNQWVIDRELTLQRHLAIGRGAECDIVVDDPHCSRNHAELFCENDRWMLRDLSSHNGTAVDGQRLESDHQLKPGNVIEIGLTKLVFADRQCATRLTTSQESTDDAAAASEQRRSSVSDWIDDLKDATDSRVETARTEIWQRYYDRLVELARRKLGDAPRRAEDEEDAVVSAFESFFEGVRNGDYPLLDDRCDLWRILATITARKVCRQIERQMAQKRGCGRIAGAPTIRLDADSAAANGMEYVADPTTDQALAVEFRETWARYLESLTDKQMRVVATLRIQGYSNAEIAAELGVTERTIERKFQHIRKCWIDMADERAE
jgi:RNA polymerase sigma factor (sigma-70 family)